MEINFYQIDDLLHKMIAPLLLKIYDQKKKALILSENEEMTQKLDLGLWNFSKTKFLPHITDQDDFDLKTQPILLTEKEENFNDRIFKDQTINLVPAHESHGGLGLDNMLQSHFSLRATHPLKACFLPAAQS